MPMVGVSHCPSCQAVVNVKWTACPACHGAIKGTRAAPFEVGDSISYQVPGNLEEGPYEIVEISQCQGAWWALVLKPGRYAWINKCLITNVQPQTQK